MARASPHTVIQLGKPHGDHPHGDHHHGGWARSKEPGLWLIVFLWVRQDTKPAQGKRLFSLAVLCTYFAAQLLLHFIL